jgi:hypothetical protein
VQSFPGRIHDSNTWSFKPVNRFLVPWCRFQMNAYTWNVTITKNNKFGCIQLKHRYCAKLWCSPGLLEVGLLTSQKKASTFCWSQHISQTCKYKFSWITSTRVTTKSKALWLVQYSESSLKYYNRVAPRSLVVLNLEVESTGFRTRPTSSYYKIQTYYSLRSIISVGNLVLNLQHLLWIRGSSIFRKKVQINITGK